MTAGGLPHNIFIYQLDPDVKCQLWKLWKISKADIGPMKHYNYSTHMRI